MARQRRAGVEDLAERELVVALCGVEQRRAAAWDTSARLLERCDEARLLALLARLRLTAIVGERALAIAGADAFPGLARGVRAALAGTRRTAELHAIVAGAVLERLTRAGVAAAPLKGVELAQRIYGDPGMRPSADVDVLVDAGCLDQAVAVVRTLGYGPPPHPDAPWFAELHHQLAHPLATMPSVEVHWRAEWYSAHASCGGLAGAALHRSRPHPEGQGRRLVAADELALLLLVYARDAMVGLRLPADIAAWWDRYAADVPSGGLQAIIDADPPLATPLATAALSCARLVGLPAPALLDLSPARSLRARLAGRLADPFLDEPTVRGASALVDGLLSSRRTLRPFLRRRVLPPAGHVALLYGDAKRYPPGSLRLRMLRAQHPVRQLAYYAWFVGSPPPRPPVTE